MKENYFKEVTGSRNINSHANHKTHLIEGKYKGLENVNNLKLGDLSLDKKNNFRPELKHLSFRNIKTKPEKNLLRPKSAGLINFNTYEMKRNDKSNLEAEKDLEKESALEIRKNLHNYLNKFGKRIKNEKKISNLEDFKNKCKIDHYQNFSPLDNNYINERENLTFNKIHSKSNSKLDSNQNRLNQNKNEIIMPFRHISPEESLPKKNLYDYHTKERDIHKLNMNIENFFSN